MKVNNTQRQTVGPVINRSKPMASETLGFRIKSVRKAWHWSQRHMASALNMIQSTVSLCESESIIPSGSAMVAMAALFSCSVEALEQGTNWKLPESPAKLPVFDHISSAKAGRITQPAKSVINPRESVNQDTLGSRIESVRTAWNWSQEHMSSALGVDQATISNWNRDRLLPHGVAMVALAALFNCSLQALQHGTGWKLPEGPAPIPAFDHVQTHEGRRVLARSGYQLFVAYIGFHKRSDSLRPFG